MDQIKKRRSPSKKVASSVKNTSLPEMSVSNGLAEAVGYNPGFGFPMNQGSPYTEQISNVTTSFINLRWYLVSNYRNFLSELFVEIGLVQTIVTVPVDDGLRGGVELKSKQLSEDQILELQGSLDRDDDLTVAGDAAKWNRLFGGAGILILTDADPSTPFDIKEIDANTKLELRACDMWELFWDKQNSEGYDPAIQQEDFEFYNYYGEQVHKSRVMRLKGITAPAFIRPRLRGWGFSVVETLIRSMNQYLKATDLTFEVLDEFKLDIYKIKNLTNTLASATGSAKVRERIAIGNHMKNYQNALVMDSEDDYDHKQLSFAGLGDALLQIRMQVASVMRMPITKLFGVSATGFNSGEDDIEVYNAMVESQVRNKLKYDILRICEIKCQKLFGFVPKDLSLSFKPLRVLSAEQEENVKTQKFSRLSTAMTSAWITMKEFRDACNKGDLFDIMLDTDDATIGLVESYQSDMITEGANDPDDNSKDIDDPGANRVDTRKARATEVGGAPKGNIKPVKSDKSEKAKADTVDPATKNHFIMNDFDESKHPRADDGKFGKGGGGGESTEKKFVAVKNPSEVVSKTSFSDTAKGTLKSYKEDNYVLINTFLRNPETAKVKGSSEVRDANEIEKSRAKKEITIIDKAFKKSRLQKDVEVYRGFISKSLSENPEHVVGKTIIEDGYLSTTTEKEKKHKDFGSHNVFLNIRAKSGTPAINMDLFEEGSTTGESEILFPSGGGLKILGFSKTPQGIQYDAELVYDDSINNEIMPYTTIQRMERILKNSAEFDRASYEADGGDDIYDPARVRALVALKDGYAEPLWEKAKEASKKSYGEIKWPFVLFMFEKMGGKL